MKPSLHLECINPWGWWHGRTKGNDQCEMRGIESCGQCCLWKAISNGKVHLLLVPIENTLGGTIHANCDLQLQHNLFIIVPWFHFCVWICFDQLSIPESSYLSQLQPTQLEAEHNLRIRHSLLALPGTKKARKLKKQLHVFCLGHPARGLYILWSKVPWLDIVLKDINHIVCRFFLPLKESLQKVISHPQALAQCNSYLKSNDLVGEAAYDTAGSAKLIAEGSEACQSQQSLCIFFPNSEQLVQPCFLFSSIP